MAKALVVVESPAKAKTINKYLGHDYTVIASMGHIRDLPKSKLGVDVDNDFAETYESLATRKKVIKELKDAAKDAADIYVATDPDREGEAIGWHLTQELAGKKRKIHRLTFNEMKEILQTSDGNVSVPSLRSLPAGLPSMRKTFVAPMFPLPTDRISIPRPFPTRYP